MDVEIAPEGFTTWHITWGTYGARLHGGRRPTVARSANAVGNAFCAVDAEREDRARSRMSGAAVSLTGEQRSFIEAQMLQVCERGRWLFRTCAAEADHVHVLCDLPQAVHGKAARRWLKTWLTASLNERFGGPDAGRWWAEGGSTRVVSDALYLQNVTDYVRRQRAT